MVAMAQGTVVTIVDELVEHFDGRFTRAEVAFVVEDSWHALEQHARTPHYLTILLRKDACDRLTQMARYREGESSG
ncbi:three-helix bundle dimerization domain-containing protein [Serinicoccus kebangsaanensis]|uniref:three-helix bundle dimerization domain-containing protein n=1 Tax=Serinicoccus kebangsaanensis TaxID=2602069 RepID=UPI00124DB3B8|nr:hypothetical protein [Serinicoccus kebangsaanensis]